MDAKMSPVGWEALDQWDDDVARIERFQTGVANDLWSVRVNGQLEVGRLGRRSDTGIDEFAVNRLAEVRAV